MKSPLEFALSAAEAATQEILKVYRSGDFKTELKADQSPITRADRQADLAILEILAATKIPCVTEETCPPYEQRRDWKRLWLVDPLDGTKDFIAHNDEFTVNIALIQNGAPILGVVAAPALNLCYYGEKNKGAFLKDASGTRRIRNTRSEKELIAAESRFHNHPKVDEFCAQHGIKVRRKFGSALKLCKLAEGVVDVYPRFTGTMEWDTAAGHCLLVEADCKISAVASNEELKYNKQDLHNPQFIAQASRLNLSAS